MLLVIGFIDLLIEPGYSAANLLLLFVRELGIGLVVGLVVGAVAVRILQRAPPRHRRAVSGGLAHRRGPRLRWRGHTAWLGISRRVSRRAGDRFATTIPAERTIVSFHQGLGWLAQVAMFLSLGLLVFPGQLPDVALKGTVLAVVLVLLARPIAVAVATLPFDYTWRERSIVGWAGLRGAVPVVLATFPVIRHVPHSLQFFNIVFFAVLLSTLVQGLDV